MCAASFQAGISWQSENHLKSTNLDTLALNSLLGVVKIRSIALAPIVVMFAVCGCGKNQPQSLDLSAYYTLVFDQPAPADSSGIAGQRIFDGVPFRVNGRAELYGKQITKNRAKYPDITGVKVGRSFEELHLLHATQWPDVEGVTIARVRINYADGTKKELDIGYGVHVRDWQRLQTEEREAVTDPDTKVVWRGPGVPKFRSSQRLFKSVMKNPLPTKRVDTVDFLSAGRFASYGLYAATVADSDSSRPVTPPAPLDRPEWDFNGRLHVRVLDRQGYPIEKACIDSSLSFPDSGWATCGSPLYSSADGTGIVKYPKERTARIKLIIEKEGWQDVSQWVDLKENENSDKGIEVTFRLLPSP